MWKSIGFLPHGHESRPYSPARMDCQVSEYSSWFHSCFSQSSGTKNAGELTSVGGLTGLTGFSATLAQSPGEKCVWLYCIHATVLPGVPTPCMQASV